MTSVLMDKPKNHLSENSCSYQYYFNCFLVYLEYTNWYFIAQGRLGDRNFTT